MLVSEAGGRHMKRGGRESKSALQALVQSHFVHVVYWPYLGSVYDLVVFCSIAKF